MQKTVQFPDRNHWFGWVPYLLSLSAFPPKKFDLPNFFQNITNFWLIHSLIYYDISIIFTTRINPSKFLVSWKKCPCYIIDFLYSRLSIAFFFYELYLVSLPLTLQSTKKTRIASVFLFFIFLIFLPILCNPYYFMRFGFLFYFFSLVNC